MSVPVQRKPSFLEAGVPCSSLSAECQADNDARQRPPQNRLHIWWARRPPTICRVAVVSALLSHDADLDAPSTAALDPPVREEDLLCLFNKEREHLAFYQNLLRHIPPTELPLRHRRLLLALRVFGDPARFVTHREAARKARVPLPKPFSKYLSGNRDPSVPADLIQCLRNIWGNALGTSHGVAPVLLDFMVGGGRFPWRGCGMASRCTPMT